MGLLRVALSRGELMCELGFFNRRGRRERGGGLPSTRLTASLRRARLLKGQRSLNRALERSTVARSASEAGPVPVETERYLPRSRVLVLRLWSAVA